MAANLGSAGGQQLNANQAGGMMAYSTAAPQQPNNFGPDYSQHVQTLDPNAGGPPMTGGETQWSGTNPDGTVWQNPNAPASMGMGMTDGYDPSMWAMNQGSAGGINEAAMPQGGPQRDPTIAGPQISIAGSPVNDNRNYANQANPSTSGSQMPYNPGQNNAAAYAPGVASGTDPSQAGWTYGTASGGPIQDSVNSGGVDTARIDPARMPVSQVDRGGNYMQNMQDAYMQQAQSRLDPQFQQREADLQNRLAQQGITPGSEAYNREMQNLAFERTDAYGNARNQAILNSGAEAARRQGMDINSGNFANQAAQQNFLNQGQAQQWGNAAQGQRFGQELAGAQFGNAAQQQQWQQRYMSDQARNQAMAQQGGLQNQRYGAELGLQGAQAGANASSHAAGLANQAANRNLDLQQQQQDWRMMTEGMFLPYQLQNMQMQGMYPTGMPNAPSYGTAPSPNGGNYLTGAQNQYNANQDWNSALGTFGGAMWNMFGR